MSRYLTRIPPFDDLDWDVEECNTGEAIIERVITHGETYDVVFVDEHFDTAGGVLRGSQVMVQLRAARLAHQPILITTSGNCLAEDVEYYASCGADSTFGKPLPNKFELARRLLALLKRKRGPNYRDSAVLPDPKRPRTDDRSPNADRPEPPRPQPRRSTRKRSTPDSDERPSSGAPPFPQSIVVVSLCTGRRLCHGMQS